MKEAIVNNNTRESADKWKFTDIIANPEIQERWEKVRKYFFTGINI